MTNEEIDKELRELLRLKNLNSAKTKDGVQIEVGKIYYVLENLRKGFEEVIIDDRIEFTEEGIYNHKDKKWGYSIYYRYWTLFSSKQAAYDDMKKFLENQIKQSENSIKNNKESLKLLDKLEI